jgi:DDE superfamily endonuclease/Archaeal putative transposase ISC1217
MWTMIASLQGCVDGLALAFTQPSFLTCSELLLGWVMCLGKHTLLRVGHTVHPEVEPDHSQRHGLDSYYNFFERSSWSPKDLAYRVALLALTRLKLLGAITLVIDDTLAHKRGKSVWGLGWFRDAVASTQKRAATASGHNWVVLAIAVCVPFTSVPILALPVLARLHRPGKDQFSCAQLAKGMLAEFRGWFPDRAITVVADGAYACQEVLSELPERVTFVGRMRGDAAVYDPRVPKAKKGKRGPKAKKGPRLPSPKAAAQKADRKRVKTGEWLWREVEATAYGVKRTLRALAYEAVWPRVLGLRRIKVVVVRDPEGKMRDCYLFTTDLTASPEWVITQFAWRWSIEVLFRASKQIMDIEAPQHFCQESVEKLAPWVWSMQGVIMVWYVTAGYESAEAAEMRARRGKWDSEWSLRHMIQVLQRTILNTTIDTNSANHTQMREMVQTLQNWALLAA